jgi:alpha-beta hydrolase superfamily lysophospholipase
VRDEILKAVKETHEEYPNFKVVSTGHSLGGAIATLAVAELRDQGHVVDLVINPLLHLLRKIRANPFE